MQQVHVQRVFERRAANTSLTYEPALQQRPIECLSVERYQGRKAAEEIIEVGQKLPLIARAAQKELPDPDDGPVDEAGPDQERVCARSSTQAGRLGVQEHRSGDIQVGHVGVPRSES